MIAEVLKADYFLEGKNLIETNNGVWGSTVCRIRPSQPSRLSRPSLTTKEQFTVKHKAAAENKSSKPKRPDGERPLSADLPPYSDVGKLNSAASTHAPVRDIPASLGQVASFLTSTARRKRNI